MLTLHHFLLQCDYVPTYWYTHLVINEDWPMVSNHSTVSSVHTTTPTGHLAPSTSHCQYHTLSTHWHARWSASLDQSCPEPIAITLNSKTRIIRLRVDRKEQGLIGRGIRCLLGVGSGENFFKFSSKNARFYAFLLQKNYTCGQKPGPGGLIYPLGLKM